MPTFNLDLDLVAVAHEDWKEMPGFWSRFSVAHKDRNETPILRFGSRLVAQDQKEMPNLRFRSRSSCTWKFKRNA